MSELINLSVKSLTHRRSSTTLTFSVSNIGRHEILHMKTLKRIDFALSALFLYSSNADLRSLKLYHDLLARSTNSEIALREICRRV